MARRLNPAETARHARLLLDQAIVLLDDANLAHVAVHADLARQLLDQWLCLPDSGLPRAEASRSSASAILP